MALQRIKKVNHDAFVQKVRRKLSFTTHRREQNFLLLLEGTYSDHPVQQPHQFGADQKLKLVVKGIVQMPFKH